ncbi:hypothetical protein JCM3774_003169 [Rhodotorula dairenensis]
MPAAPRAAVPRKSVVPDPDLYAHSDGSDSDSPRTSHLPPPKRTRTSAATSAALVRKGSKGPQPTRGSVTTETGRRRSTRLSNEHPQQQQQQQPDHDAKPRATAAGKKRAKPESEIQHGGSAPAAAGGSDDDDDDDRPASAPSRGAATAHGPTSKRPRLEGAAESSSRTTNTTAPPAVSAPPPAAAAAAPARRGFIPRAAADLATRVNKPPPAFSAALVDPAAAGDESGAAEPFLFTTNPPTPYSKGTTNTTHGQLGKGKAPRTAAPPTRRNDPADDADASDAAAAKPLSSRRRRTPPPAASQQKPVAPIHVHETPVQVRNIAFRQGLPPGTPATIARSARRSSARGSGKRGSSIGGGFEAVPHPQVADDKLYRSTDASDPIAKRLRSIVSWAAQRTRDRIFRGTREDEMSAAQAAAKRVVDGFIDDVCSLRIDTSVPYQEPSQSQDPARLPPHPQNESNAAKMQELEDSYAAIAREQELRQSLEPTYQSFFDTRTHAHASTSQASIDSLLPAAARSNSAAYAATLDLSVAAPTSLEEALALGRRVMQGDLVRKDGGGKAAKKGKGKLDADVDETLQDAIQRRITEAQIDTAAFRHQTHRLLAFTRVAAAYVTHRSSETHAALTRHNELGTAARSTAPPPTATGATAPEGAAGLASALPVSGPLASSTTATATGSGPPVGSDAQTRAMDPRDLLRAIAESDLKRRS